MWELIDETGKDANTKVVSHRLSVPNGWIVRTITSRYHGGTHTSQTFINDTNHQWKLEKSS